MDLVRPVQPTRDYPRAVTAAPFDRDS